MNELYQVEEIEGGLRVFHMGELMFELHGGNYLVVLGIFRTLEQYDINRANDFMHGFAQGLAYANQTDLTLIKKEQP